MSPRLSPHLQIESLRHTCAALERELEYLRRQRLAKLKLAAQVHRSLLPQPVRHERVLIDVRYNPIEEVGGDYCQVRFADRHSCYLTMCDVAGHGVGPALLATRISSEVRYALMHRQEPRDIVRALERFLREYFDSAELLLSFVAVKLDFDRMTLTWSGAGHPSPLIFDRERRDLRQLPSQNPLIGLSGLDYDAFQQDTIPIQSGDRLFVFTDGLVDVFDAKGVQLATDDFGDIVKATGHCDLFEVADRLLQAVADRQYGPNLDDQTLLVAEIR
ncbi:MAG: hypothetical protein Kow0040_16510 [Thermogutta sp.]